MARIQGGTADKDYSSLTDVVFCRGLFYWPLADVQKNHKGEITMTNPNGRFGIHGGQYVPEALMGALEEV